MKRKERAESEQIAKETVEDAGNEAADKDQEDIEEDGMRRARKKRRML